LRNELTKSDWIYRVIAVVRWWLRKTDVISWSASSAPESDALVLAYLVFTLVLIITLTGFHKPSVSKRICLFLIC
jgi:hypothetical protein